VSLEGFIGNTFPVNFPKMILVITAFPTLPSLFDAPNTAMLEGEIRFSKLIE
jgi:hypothetical protein